MSKILMSILAKMSNHPELINTWLQAEIASIANELDRQPKLLKKALQSMSNSDFLALKVPIALGGRGLAESDYRPLQINMARHSAALTFLQTQHQSALSMLAKSQNKYLQQEFLATAIQQQIFIGVGFSHLRRSIPMMKARVTTDGYLFTGQVPWITGYQHFSYFICGANLDDGQEIYGILPFSNQATAQGKLTINPPLELIAATATNTVTAEIDRWYVPKSLIVQLKPAGAIHISSRQNILNHGFYAIGCAYAGLDLLQQLAEKKQLDFLEQTWRTLTSEVDRLREQAIASISTDISYQQKLKLRAAAINLAQRCSLAAITAAGGSANYLHSSAGRVYREALLFSVSGQTTDVMAASLEQLSD